MSDQTQLKPKPPSIDIMQITESLSQNDLNDLCDATDAAIESGGGFGWVHLPSRDILERYWQGVITAPTRWLFVARLDGVICGTAQLMIPAKNNEAQAHMVKLTTNFVAPWAQGHGIAKLLLEEVERISLRAGYSIVNLEVRETKDRAISLFESSGYIQFGVHPYSVIIDDKIIQSRHYYKLLDPKAFEKN